MTVALHHLDEGTRDAPAVLLAPSLGTTLGMWDGLTAVLSRRYRVVPFDLRGHGGSPVPPGPYSLEELAGDVLRLADGLGVDRFGFVGLSLGGAIGQVLALDHPDRVAGLVLCCTGPRFADPQTWHDRAALVRAEGMAPLAAPTTERWFTAGFQQQHPEVVDRIIGMLTATSPDGYAACCDALASYDVTSRLGSISAPTRVIAGAEDPVTGPEVAEHMVAAIPGSDLRVLDGVSHIANVAAPTEFADAVLGHLDRHLGSLPSRR
jgi:3-oxoadipate enol-lactonase